MDHVHGALTALVPLDPSTKSGLEAYDASIRQYLATLRKSAAEIQAVVLSDPEGIFKILDPAQHSIGYLHVLDILLSPSNSAPLPISSNVLLDKIVDFLLKFDHIQVRYVGPEMLALMERVAYHSNAVDEAMEVLGGAIYLYPNMAGSKENKLLCDPTLAPFSYLSAQTGLSGTVRPSMILEYDHIRGLIYTSRRDWGKAEAAFQQVISYPCKERVVSKIMVDSYKRWILIGLLRRGKAPTTPAFTSSNANSCYMTAAKHYLNVAETFGTTGAGVLKSLVEENAATWEEDGTASLMAEILSSYQKWQVLGLRDVYQRIGLARIRATTLSAETGTALEDDDAVAALLRDMMESGMLQGELEQQGDERYLLFSPDSDVVSEAEFARMIAQSHHNIRLLGRQYQLVNDRLSGSKEYVRQLVKEQKRAEKDGVDPGVGFDSQIEDEDLMAGILAHV
ncbi:hypothetical protein UVI_02026530 [Ustilaginoidea virens]|uniref:COP9 signalosome complex subunit 3 N-terminal helical repeats domain-containing protein n=1 Tax=Ustilaginoidea virens TaxID=1159556 RepID=A0A1B5L140_USTVR|nr:hypothetical protein UVI_02026530 [Ustilaginoidea virens]